MITKMDFQHFAAVGPRLSFSPERFRIHDKFKDGELALLLLHDEASGRLELFIVDGILNLNGRIVLLLGSAEPEDRESSSRSYAVFNLHSDSVVEIEEEGLVNRIADVAEEAVLLNRIDNLARVESVLGQLRVFEHGKEVVPSSL